ncbi:hypothetical protein OF83DRAFT_1066777 [Amylostereum chailletii]|nr:hypothetical protein OF83DRAFT_1066777 [Amylostereum chailletii]
MLPVPDPSSNAPLSTSSSTLARLQPTAADLSVHDEAPFHSLLPPLKVYYPHGTSTPSVTAQLIALLPSAAALRSRITQAVEDTMRMHPCFNFKHFKVRTESMFAWAKDDEHRSVPTSNGNTNGKADLARSIFFSANPPPAPASSKPTPTLSFFASVAAAYALGVSVSKENEYVSEADTNAVRMDDPQRSTTVPSKSAVWVKCSASALYALSQQALGAFEMSNMYDLDYLVACVLQILYLLHDGKPRIAHVVYPLVGKIVNIAQMMGLATDPDEFPGRYTLFEAEQRRRLWWDIYYYDVFVADCMGHMPIIQDNTYTTKIPADVDEEQFTPASSTLPVPVPRGAGGDPSEVGFAFFALKCR